MMEATSFEYECVVCTDTKSIVYKICQCHRGYLCFTCKELMEKQKSIKCPVCRQNIRMDKSYKICESICNVIRIYWLIAVHVILSFIVPLVYFKYRYYDNDDVYNSIYNIVNPKFDDYIIKEPAFYTITILGDLLIIPCVILSWNLCNILLINHGDGLSLSGTFGKAYLYVINCLKILFVFITIQYKPSKAQIQMYVIPNGFCNLVSFICIMLIIVLFIAFKHLKSFAKVAIPYDIFYKNYGVFQNHPLENDNIILNIHQINRLVHEFDMQNGNSFLVDETVV
jgi:hypothetical protein